MREHVLQRARAVGFLMALHQRRRASSTYTVRHSLQNRASRLTEGLQRAQTLARQAPPVLPDPEELEEMEEGERDRLQEPLRAVTLAGNAEQVHEEITELCRLAQQAHALDAAAVFNVVGEILPAAHVERVLRDYYAGHLGDVDLEERLLRHVDVAHFRAICQDALEGLAAKKLNLEILIERRARAQERRVVPETIARFLGEASAYVPLTLDPVPSLPHTFESVRIPTVLRRYTTQTG